MANGIDTVFGLPGATCLDDGWVFATLDPREQGTSGPPAIAMNGAGQTPLLRDTRPALTPFGPAVVV